MVATRLRCETEQVQDRCYRCGRCAYERDKGWNLKKTKMNKINIISIILAVALFTALYVLFTRERQYDITVRDLNKERERLRDERNTLERLYLKKSDELENWIELYKYQKALAEQRYNDVVKLQKKYDSKKNNPVVIVNDHERDSILSALYPELFNK
jgi:hypothetical protein